MAQVSFELNESLQRELHRQEVIMLEEKERERRMRAEKTHSEDKVHFSDAKEAVQRELVSKFDLVQVREAEEKERQRREWQERVANAKQDVDDQFESKANLLITKNLEEKERERRISEELHRKLQEAIDREMERRKTWLAEEEERQRRMKEGTHDKTVAEKALLKDIVEVVNQKVAEKAQVQKGAPRRVTEEKVKKVMKSSE